MRLQDYIVQLDHFKEPIVVFGNFSRVKATYDIPNYQRNPMEREDVVEFFKANGTARALGVVLDYRVTAYIYRGKYVLEACKGQDTRYIIGAE